MKMGLPEILQRNTGKNLTFTTELAAAVSASRLSLIAVGTPTSEGEIDLSQVETAARPNRACASRDEPTDIRSCSRARASQARLAPWSRRSCKAESGKTEGTEVGFGANPEFLTEGQAVRTSWSQTA